MDISKKNLEDFFDIKQGVSHFELKLKGLKQERMLDDYIKAHEKSFVE